MLSQQQSTSTGDQRGVVDVADVDVMLSGLPAPINIDEDAIIKRAYIIWNVIIKSPHEL